MYDSSFTPYNQKAASYLIEGIIKARTVNLKDVVTKISCPASADSLYRRFQRFFKKEMELCGIGVFLLRSFLEMCLRCLPSPVKLYLIVDRHEWSYGSKVNNLLVAYAYEPVTGIDFPVSVIDLDRRGSSDTLARGDVIAHLLPALRPLIDDGRLIVTVLGDREFFSHDWKGQLVANGLGYTLRIKRSFVLSSGANVEDLYANLDVGQIIDCQSDSGRVVIKHLSDAPGRRDSCLAVVTDDRGSDSDSVLDDYAARWTIERGFFNLESNGWELQKTHLKCAKRVEMMFYILAICYYISVLFGYILSRLQIRRIKKHGYKSASLFLRGRRLIAEIFTRKISLSFRCIILQLESWLAKLFTNVAMDNILSVSRRGVV